MIVNFTKSEMSACAGILFFLKAHGHQSTYHALKACLQTQKKLWQVLTYSNENFFC